MTFSILTVCTGNVCRSPVAELQLSAALRNIPEVLVASAGSHALVGSGVPPTTLTMGREYGLDASEHRARQLTEDQIREADLILAMARDHRRAIVEAVPGAVRRTFTLRELARIADLTRGGGFDQIDADAPPLDISSSMRAAVARAAALRGSVGPVEDQRELDVTDPFGRSDDTYRRSFAQLIPAVASVAFFLTEAMRDVTARR
ncbi:low molecular weight phosphatase family protein [Microbacterium sp. 5K110]|uniref:arsenate reductase/protein-tyrosine-phosphatase family protein n=1 Tax=unclassified Microbacterium TaxID=2609290 RepID=UPI00207BA4A6|nr:low molecular weight phosphatase family protein [Microbacterium sp. 5K110]